MLDSHRVRESHRPTTGDYFMLHLRLMGHQVVIVVIDNPLCDQTHRS